MHDEKENEEINKINIEKKAAAITTTAISQYQYSTFEVENSKCKQISCDIFVLFGIPS